MAGGEPDHGLIAVNVSTAIHNALRAKSNNCRVYSSDVKIAINRANRRCYPDVSVVCGPEKRDIKESKAIINPILVVEVLSESTELLDRGEKFRAYIQIETLQEYVLISQEKALVEIFSKTPDGTWSIKSFAGLNQKIEIPALAIALNSTDLYYGLEKLS
ncbi:UNVERIFIED_CONTAM: hypothetical protein GTU68_036639 [Idotea baltica]|nr:hypothetical protein [Idotea baltica]